jgi:hypothetical protein
MILSSPARGHVIIHQARASDRNFMHLPCTLRPNITSTLAFGSAPAAHAA